MDYGVFHSSTGFCKLAYVDEDVADRHCAELNKNDTDEPWIVDEMTDEDDDFC